MLRIFQTGSKSFHELAVLEEKAGEKHFDHEKVLQELIEDNLNDIFKDLEFVKSEHTIGGFRPDTIAFDNGRNSFAIIEYKNKRNESLIEQGISYYQLLQEKRGEFVLLYNKLKKKKLDIDDVNWNDTRIIFISPEFSIYQKKASRFRGLPAEMWEVKRYEKGFITLKRIDSQDEYSSDAKKEKSHKKESDIIKHDEEDFLDGKYGSTKPSEKTRKLWYKFKSILLDKFENLEYAQKKKYGGFYSETDNSCVCTMFVTKDSINLSYAVTKKDMFHKTNFVLHTLKGHHGVGHFVSKIRTIKDIETALPYIEQVYQLKTK